MSLKDSTKQDIVSHLEKIIDSPPWHMKEKLKHYTEQLRKEYIPQELTRPQMNSIYLFCGILSDTLNTLGLEMKLVLKPSYQLWWNKQAVHDHIWLPVQTALFGSKSVKELEKLGQIDQIHEQVMKALTEKFAEKGLEYIPFPHNEPNE